MYTRIIQLQLILCTVVLCIFCVLVLYCVMYFHTLVRILDRNRSSVVELVGREPLMFAKVENGVTKSRQNFRRKKTEKTNFGLNFSTF